MIADLLKSFIGPLIVGLAVWCAAGEVAAVTAASAAPRVAVPAPWWVVALAIAMASLVPAWRRRPVTALPALMACLPWLPLPLPAVALMWTGPLAWLPIVCAAAAAVAGSSRGGTLTRFLALPPGLAAGVAGALTLALAVTTAWSIDPRLPGGDEPHYLVITQSVLQDGDLRIENNHVNRDYAAYFGGELAPDVIQRGQDGQIYSIHAPGVSLLVAPGFRWLGYRGAQLTILIVAALAGVFIWWSAFLASDDQAAAWVAWLAVAGSATFLLQSAMVFPDGPGAMATAAGGWLFVRLRRGEHPPGWRALVGVSLLLAALPWLHTRFVVLAAGLGIAIVVLLIGDAGHDQRRRVSRVAAFLAVPVLSAAAWFGFFFVIYGTPSPTAPYGTNPETSAAFVPGGLAGLLFDQQFGLLVVTPILAAAVGVRRRADRWAWTGTAIALAYLAVAATYWMWWAGRPATPARFATAALPLLAVPIAVAWRTWSAPVRRVWLAVLGWSLGQAALLIGIGRGALAWNDRDANARLLEWLGPVVDLPRAWPSFFWRLDPGDLSSEWAFAVHAAVLVAIVVLSGALLAALATRGAWDARRRIQATIAWSLVLPVVLVQAGWWLSGAPPLDPARGQIAALRHAAAGGSPLAIGTWAVSRSASALSALQIAPESPGRLDTPSYDAVFTAVPPGRYALVVTARLETPGRLTARLQRNAAPIAEVEASNRPSAAPVIDLPAGARLLLIESDAVLRRAGATVALRPLTILSGPPVGAVSRADYGAVTAWFLDAAVFPEPSGFWIRGGATAAVLLAAAPGRVIPLTIQNGGAAQRAVVVTGDDEASLDLDASEVRQLEITAGPDGRAWLSIASPGGFRPSETGGGGDERFLGIWVAPR